MAPSDCCRGDSELVNEVRTRCSDTVGVCGSQSEGGLLLFWAIETMLPCVCVWVCASPEGVADVMQRLRNPFPAFSNQWRVMFFLFSLHHHGCFYLNPPPSRASPPALMTFTETSAPMLFPSLLANVGFPRFNTILQCFYRWANVSLWLPNRIFFLHSFRENYLNYLFRKNRCGLCRNIIKKKS